MSRLWHGLASLKLTFPSMVVLAIAIFASYRSDGAPHWWMTVPLTVLSLNLMAAICCHRAFRAQPALLVFHVCLLLVLGLVNVSRLMGFSARAEVVAGQPFDPSAVAIVQRGYWADASKLNELRFDQQNFSIAYSSGLVRGETKSHVWLRDPNAVGQVSFGDTRPIEVSNCRLYTTSNKGFSAVLQWLGRDGQVYRGTVNFPSYPLHDWQQINYWTTPSGRAVELELLIERAIDIDAAWRFDARALAWVKGLMIRHGSQEDLVMIGESRALGDGVVTFVEPSLWMGYRIVYQPMISTILAFGLVAVAALAVHVTAVKSTHRERSSLRTQAEPSG